MPNGPGGCFIRSPSGRNPSIRNSPPWQGRRFQGEGERRCDIAGETKLETTPPPFLPFLLRWGLRRTLLGRVMGRSKKGQNEKTLRQSRSALRKQAKPTVPPPQRSLPVCPSLHVNGRPICGRASCLWRELRLSFARARHIKKCPDVQAPQRRPGHSLLSCSTGMCVLVRVHIGSLLYCGTKQHKIFYSPAKRSWFCAALFET